MREMKGKEKKRRKVISLVWLVERRAKWVYLELLNFCGASLFAIIQNWVEREGKEEEFLKKKKLFYYKIINIPFFFNTIYILKIYK